MESSHKTLRLYAPVSERSCVSPCLSHCRGPASPFKAPLKPQRGLTSHCGEEDSTGTAKQHQADKSALTDFKEVLDDYSEICWLTELLRLCLESQTLINMGNQQGMRTKPNCYDFAESRDALQKSPRFQIPRKKRRRMEELVYSGTFQHNVKTTSGALRGPPKTRRPAKLQMTSLRTFGHWDSEEDRLNIYTPAARRKRVIASPQGPTWRAKLVDAPSEKFTSCRRAFFSPRPDLSAEEASDTDLSEYDNDVHPAYTSPVSVDWTQTTQDCNRNPLKARITHPERDRDEAKNGEAVEEKSSQWMYKESGEKAAAAQRVMGKIEEVEGIIRRVSLTSSDWIRGADEDKDEDQFVSSGKVSEEFSLQVKSKKEGSSEDKPLLVDELQALGEALTQSLRQVLKVEAAETEREPFTQEKTSQKTNLQGSRTRPLNILSHAYDLDSAVQNNSPQIRHFEDGESSDVPPSCMTTAWGASQRASSPCEGTSPILSPLLTPSQHGKDNTECSTGWKGSVEDAVESAVTGNDVKKMILRLREQTSRSSNETEASQACLLSSDEALQRQEKIWQLEVEESFSVCRSLSDPSRPKHIDFLRLTAPEDDIIDTPTSTPLPPEFPLMDPPHTSFKVMKCKCKRVSKLKQKLMTMTR
ncbi:uncharacterized protein V6R79_005853 [Siganus canaliculatus]